MLTMDIFLGKYKSMYTISKGIYSIQNWQYIIIFKILYNFLFAYTKGM